MYKIAICDDDQDYIVTLKKIILSTNLVNVDNVQFFEFYSGEQLFVHPELDFDVIIMDMQMREMDGYETAMHLRKQDSSFLLIFCSGVIKPTTKHFKSNAFRYLLKDFSEEQMLEEMTAIVGEMIERKDYPFLMCKYSQGKDQIRVYPDSILYIAIRNTGSEVFARGRLKKEYPKETLRVNMKLDEIEKTFDESCGFVRLQKSFLANMAYIKELTKEYVVLEDGTNLSVSRSHSEHVAKTFAKFASSKYKG